jgi:hypothetical protein
LKARGYEFLSTVEADTAAEAITQVKFARSAATENELRASANTSRTPEGFDMAKMIEPPKPKPHVSLRNAPWGIEAEIRQRIARRRRRTD